MSVLNKRQEQSLCLINAAMIYQAYKLKKNPCSKCAGLLRKVMFYRNAEHCDGQENREKFRLLFFSCPFSIFMGKFIEEFYYGNLDSQARSTKQNEVVQKQMEVLMLN